MSDAEELLDKARIRLEEAKALFEADLFEGAVGRAYYAAYSAARSMLTTDGIRAKTHAGVIRQFGKAHVMAGVVDAPVGRALAQLHSKRELADYGKGAAISRAEAAQAIDLAEKLVAVAKGHLAT